MPDLALIARLGTLLARHARAIKGGADSLDATSAADGEEFAKALEGMGPTYIKFGQLLSTRDDLLPATYTTALARLQDRVDAGAPFDVRAVIEESLGASVGTLFSAFDDTPLAAASLAQVHTATTRNGRDVVVKVLRPGVRETVKADMESLAELATFIDERTPIGPRLGASRMLGQFRRSMNDELDYRKEAANLALFAKLAEGEDALLIPGFIADYSSDVVLTLDRIPGKKVTDVTPLGLLDIDGPRLAATLFRFMLRAMLVDGVLHADPHPGNLLLTPDGRIGLIDLGMVARIPKPVRTALVKLLVSMGDSDGEAAAGILAAMGHPLDTFDAAAFRDEVSHLVSSTLAMGSEIQAGGVLMELARLAGAHGLRPPAEMSMVAKALLNLDRATQHLDPHFSPLEAIQENLDTIIKAGYQASLGGLFVTSLEGREFVERLPRRANRIMESLSQGELEVRIKAFDEHRALDVLAKTANRLTAGLVLGAMIVAGALLMFVDAGPRLFGYPALAAVVFIGAVIGGGWLAFSILLQDLPVRRQAKLSRRLERLAGRRPSG